MRYTREQVTLRVSADRWVVLLLVGIRLMSGVTSDVAAQSTDAGQEDFVEILRSEETILYLTPFLEGLNVDLLNLQLPQHGSRVLFADEVTFTDLVPVQKVGASSLEGRSGVRMLEWTVGDAEHSSPSSELRLWRPLLDRVAYFERASFYFERGNFLDPGRSRFEADLAFSGTARDESGTLLAVQAQVSTEWMKETPQVRAFPPVGTGGKPEWSIGRWHLQSLTTYETEQPLFADAMADALPRDDDERRARQSLREEFVIEWGRDLIADRGQFQKPHVLFDISALYQKPGV